MFLTLLEAPGTTENFKKFITESDVAENDNNESSDEDVDVDGEILETVNDFPEPILPNCMDVVCGESKVDFQDITANWKRDFSRRPTWFDAAFALQQILWGYARGFRAPLYSRVLIQRTLFKAGCFVQRFAWLVIVSLLTLFTFCSIGLRYVHIETDIVKLWVSEGGRLNDELKFLENLQQRYKTDRKPDIYESKHFILEESEDPRFTQIPEDESPTLSYQVLIQTTDDQYSSNRNILSHEHLLKHVKLVEEIAKLNVNKFGFNWDFHDLCFKPGELDIQNDSLAYSLKHTLERLIPCIWISPIDCYFEGSKPLGPSPPINTKNIPFGSILRMLISDLPEELSWKNIDPNGIMEQIKGTFDLGTVNNFFSRSGIGHGYQKRPCIDPLDPECPSTAPNYYSAYCKAMQMIENNLKENKTLDEFLAPFNEPISDGEEGNLESDKTSAFDILGAFFDGTNKSSKKKKDEDDKCHRHRKSFLRWMSANMEKARAELTPELLPNYPEYGKIMQNGCQGVAQSIMNWPAEMILGGLNKNEIDGTIQAEAFQSVFLLATPTEIFRRFKDSDKLADNSTFATNEWSPFMAREVIQEWARTFTNHLSNHPLNKVERIIHPLASNSISDMLSEYCNFNYLIIFAGYLLMLVYSLYSQCRFDGCCSLGVESAVGLALAGVLTVTLSSIAGLGISTWFDINFNAATTQIVPFLALGIGVDNVFLLLHNYPQVINNVRRNELGFLLKETGMSILTTSLNNILAFWAGTILPIPALRSFCGQTAILLTANLVGIFFIYPAFIALDLKRRKAGRRDLAFLAYYCLCLDESVGTVQQERQKGVDKEPDNDEYVEAIHFEEGEYLYKGHDKMKPNVVAGQSKNPTKQLKRQNPKRKNTKYKWYTLPGFLHIIYIPMLKLKRTKICIISFVIGLLIASIFGIKQSSIGLELSDILPENSAPAAFLKTRDKFFSFYPMNIVLRGERIDFPAQQHLIDLLRNEIANSQFVIKLPNGEPSERYWLQLFREWLRGMQRRLDKAKAEGLLDNFDSENATEAARDPDLQIAYSLACSYGQNYDCDRVGRIRIVDDSGTINAEGFYNYLYGWHEYEQMFYAVSQAGFYPRLKKLRQGPSGRMKYRFFIPPAPKPLFSRIPFYLTGLKDTPTIVQMIREIRAICENYTDKGLENYPESVAMTFWEQYLHLEYYLILAIVIISICVFLVISLIFFNPWAAAMVSITVFSMTIELAGFMGWAGVKLNPISAVTLITAVGIGVEFTAHVVISFLTSLGGKDERMVQCLEHMFVPVIHGGMSTLLGIVMLAFSQFDFVVKYFFVVMSALVIIGMFNGLALLPVLLSLIGPPCEIEPVGKRKNRLILKDPQQQIRNETNRKFMADENA